MKTLVHQGKAMPAPGQDRPGWFPIRSEADLRKAIRAVGRVNPPTEEARAKGAPLRHRQREGWLGWAS